MTDIAASTYTPLSLHTLVRQRLMLRADDPDATAQELGDILVKLCKDADPHAAVAAFGDEGLASLWDERISRPSFDAPVSDGLRAALKAKRWEEAGRYLAQRAAIAEVDSLFQAAGIAYAVFKGTHVRELEWQAPALRSANDIDILIPAARRTDAISLLERAGFTLRIDEKNLTHEVTLVRAPVTIDLHWDIIRPGRARCDLATPFLEGRNKAAGFYGLNNEATLIVMLVHPVFARYVNNLSACNVKDFEKLVLQRPIDWDAVYTLLDKAGLKTAAWTMLTWYRMVLGEHITPKLPILDAVKPGRLRQAYLRQWLEHDLSVRLWNIPLLTPLAFTLPAHDSVADVVRAVRARSELALSGITGNAGP